MKSYFALLRRLLRDEAFPPAPRSHMPSMRVHRIGAVLSQGEHR